MTVPHELGRLPERHDEDVAHIRHVHDAMIGRQDLNGAMIGIASLALQSLQIIPGDIVAKSVRALVPFRTIDRQAHMPGTVVEGLHEEFARAPEADTLPRSGNRRPRLAGNGDKMLGPPQVFAPNLAQLGTRRLHAASAISAMPG